MELDTKVGEMANKNLLEFSKRLDENITLKYDTINHQYISDQDLSNNKFDVAGKINWFKWFVINPEKQDSFVQTYLADIQSEINDIRSNLIARNDGDIDINLFVSKKDKFIKLHRNFYPMGFLSEENESLIKERLNQHCDELDAMIRPKL